MKSENTYIIHPETEEQEKALKAFVEALNIKFEVAKEKEGDALRGDALRGDEEAYDPKFIAKIQESREQVREGKISRIEKNKLQNFLGLK